MENPNVIPLFPLHGVILLPGNILPLYIFEPRYRQMIQDCNHSVPYIGMIQPYDNNGHELYNIGCLGKFDHCNHLPNGNYLIRLEGVGRFELSKEIDTNKPYRQSEVNYYNFQNDSQPNDVPLDGPMLYDAFKFYLKQKSQSISWDKIEMIPLHHLVNILSMNLELTSSEKQMLLTSKDINSRYQDLISLLQMTDSSDSARKPSNSFMN